MAAKTPRSVESHQSPSETRQEILQTLEHQSSAEVGGSDSNADLQESLLVASLASQGTLLNLNEYRDIIQLRREWSSLFKVIVWIVLLFEILLTVAVGTQLLVFEDEWFLRIIISGGIAQILAMPILVTQFLFSQNSLKMNQKEKTS